MIWCDTSDFVAIGLAHVYLVWWSTIVRFYLAPPLDVVLNGPTRSMLTVERTLEWGCTVARWGNFLRGNLEMLQLWHGCNSPMVLGRPSSIWFFTIKLIPLVLRWPSFRWMTYGGSALR
jgi:hypothetical protein